jgi:cytochrome c oxidase subunit 2
LVGFGAVGRPLATLATAAGLAVASLVGAGCGVNSGVAQPGGADLNHGKQLFAATCGGCHTLADAGTHGTTGPDLDKVLKGKSQAFIKQSIEQPNAVIAPGYNANIMPNFGQSLKPQQVDALVKYLAEVTK